MATVKAYQWFDLAGQLASELLSQTTDKPNFIQEAEDIAEEYEAIHEIFLDKVVYDGKLTIDEAAPLWPRMMDLQQRMLDLGSKIDRPI